MKWLITILACSPWIAFGQTLTKGAIENYCHRIDTLMADHELVRVSYPNMSGCGGAIEGYYEAGQLVLINSTYNAELGYSSKVIYFKDHEIVKILYRQHAAEWGKYEKRYPISKYEWDPAKMTYSDTLCTIHFSAPIAFSKSSYGKPIASKASPQLIKMLTACATAMKTQLETVLSQVDRLKAIKEIPYICKDKLCGDELFWDVVRTRNHAIELLIDKLDDATPTKANVLYFGRYYTVADIAYVVLQEIIHDIPTFELLGVDFDKSGCGYCAYWNHLNEAFEHRKKFKKAVKEWYFKHKDQLIWIANNDYSSCDCRAKHPNGGHYEVGQ